MFISLCVIYSHMFYVSFMITLCITWEAYIKIWSYASFFSCTLITYIKLSFSSVIDTAVTSVVSTLWLVITWMFISWAWLYQSVQKLVLKCGSNEQNIQIKLILSQKYCMNEIRVIGTFLGLGSLVQIFGCCCLS